MKKLITVFAVLLVGAIIVGCGDSTSESGLKTIAEKKVNNNLTVTISSAKGKLMNGEQELVLKFTDGNGMPVQVKAATLNFNMPAMGSMAEMNDAASLTTTDTPGKFNGKVKLQMAGEWIAQISYEGERNGEDDDLYDGLLNEFQVPGSTLINPKSNLFGRGNDDHGTWNMKPGT